MIIGRILASPRTDLLLWLGFLAPGLLLLATVIAGHLARRGAPVLATVATTINALAFGLMSGAVASGDLITVAGGRAGVDPATILTITDAIENSPITGTALGIWVPGHILGMVLLAVALRRARVLPRWAAVVLGVSQPIHFLAFVVLDNQYVDALAGWGFTAVGFAAVAVALLRTRDDDWDLPRHPASSHISVALTDPPRAARSAWLPARRPRPEELHDRPTPVALDDPARGGLSDAAARLRGPLGRAAPGRRVRRAGRTPHDVGAGPRRERGGRVRAAAGRARARATAARCWPATRSSTCCSTSPRRGPGSCSCRSTRAAPSPSGTTSSPTLRPCCWSRARLRRRAAGHARRRSRRAVSPPAARPRPRTPAPPSCCASTPAGRRAAPGARR